MLKPGAVYMLKGGHILRYHGVQSHTYNVGRQVKTASGNAFCCVQKPFPNPEGISGEYIGTEDVLYEITKEHIPALERRRDKYASWEWPHDVASMEIVITELNAA